MQDLLRLLSENKDVLAIIGATFAGLITFGTFTKAIPKYRLQGRQKRAEHIDKLRTTLRTDPRITQITSLLYADTEQLPIIPIQDRCCFLGFYKQIAIALNSKLIAKDVANYMFADFAIKCWKSRKSKNLLNEKRTNTANKNLSKHSSFK